MNRAWIVAILLLMLSLSLAARERVSKASGIGPTMAIDADPGTAGIQTSRSVGSFSPFQVTINLANAADVQAFSFELTYDKSILSAQTISVGSDLDRNPDANQSVLAATGRTWSCTPPDPSGDTGASPSFGIAFLSCYSTGAAAGPSFDAAGAAIATITFSGEGAGTASLTLQNVAVYTAGGSELGSCNPDVVIAAACTGANVTVAGGPTQLAFVQQPAGATYGAKLTSDPVVAVEDGGNNVVTTDQTTLVTLSAQGGAGTLSCTGGLTQQVVNGQASFQGCTVSAAGNYTLHATSSPTLTAADSNSFAMTAPGGTTGLLRVTTSPGVPSQVQVNGIPMDDWALNWVKLPPGQYTVSFSDLQGFTTPAPQTVTVTAGQTTTVQGSFIRRGNLRVVTSPPVPSTISVDGVPRNDWGVWTDLPAGSYQVCFGDVAGFNTPSCQTANLTAGQTTVITGTFTVNAAAPGPAAGYGLLRVTTSPAVPGQVLVDGVPMTDWGLDWVKLPPGTYTVSFTNIPNFTSPPPQVVTVTAGQTTSAQGSYVQRGFLRVITSPPVPGTISVNGLPREDWGLWTSVEPGSYQVCFGAAPGFSNTPTCQTQNVTVNTLTTFTGTYIP